MSKIPIDEAQEGMTLASECLDDRGNVLVKEGMVLSEQWIERLKGRGVTHVDVQAEGDSGPVSNSGPEDIQATMKTIFAPVLSSPHMTPLAKATYAFFRSL